MKNLHLAAWAVPVVAIAILSAAVLFQSSPSEPDVDRTAGLERRLLEETARADALETELNELKAAPERVDPLPAKVAPQATAKTGGAKKKNLKKKGSYGPKDFKALAMSKDLALVRKAVDGFMASDEPWQHKTGVELIRIHGLVDRLPTVVELLSSKVAWERRQAARTLGELGDPRAVEPLESLYADGSLLEKRIAAQALQGLGRPEVLQEFIATATAYILGDPDGGLRVQGVRQLGALRDGSTIPVLTEALKDTNSAVRSGAALALGRIGDPSALEALAALLDDPVASVRDAAERSQLWIEDPASRQNLKDGY